MERKEFLRLIDSIYKGNERIPWRKLNKQQAKFIGSLLKDRKRILELFSRDEIGKKGGISGKNLPLTVKILNKDDENPAVEKYVGYDNRWLVIYFGISPELENFVSIIMWPESKSSKECYRTILSFLEEDKRSLKFVGAYHLILPNEIHPQRVEKLEIERDEQLFYSWQYFPFIKDVGETLSKPIFAPNYRKVLLRNINGQLFEDYLTLRTTVGSIMDIRGREIKVKVPFLKTEPHYFIFRLRHNVQKRIRKKSLYYFLLIERAGERIPEVFDIDSAGVEDALAHCLAFELYKRFIKSVSRSEYRRYIVLQHKEELGFEINEKEISNLFGICSIEEGEKLFKKYSSLLYKIYHKEWLEWATSNISLWDIILETFLLPYFRIDEENNRIYYFPVLFRHHPQHFLCEKIIEVNKIVRSYVFGVNKSDNY